MAGHGGGPFVLARDPPFANGRALHDPFVVGLDHLREFFVGQTFFRHKRTCAEDDGSVIGHCFCLESQILSLRSSSSALALGMLFSIRSTIAGLTPLLTS